MDMHSEILEELQERQSETDIERESTSTMQIKCI